MIAGKKRVAPVAYKDRMGTCDVGVWQIWPVIIEPAETIHLKIDISRSYPTLCRSFGISATSRSRSFCVIRSWSVSNSPACLCQ